MSLDGSLPGFYLHRRERGQVELMSKHTRKVVYSAFRAPGPAYDCVLEDALFQSPLARCTAPGVHAKEKALELFNPDVAVAGGVKQIGRLSYTWQFVFGGETFEFRQPKLSNKEFTLFLLRHPDPPVDVARFAITPSASPWRGGAELTLLQYNIDRFAEITDPKGLEVLALVCFVGFWDAYEDRANGGRPAEGAGAGRRFPSGGDAPSSSPGPSAPPPPPPPLPPKKAADELVGWEDFAEPPNPNEIPLANEPVPALAARAFDLLKDPAMLFVVLKARSPDEIAKGVRVVEEVGRLRLRRWEELEAGSEMHQYLVEEQPAAPPPAPARRPSPPAKQPPRTINLNDSLPASSPSSSASLAPPNAQPPRRMPSTTSQPWDKAPPQAMSIFLSKIVLPDLQPKSASSPSSSPRPSSSSAPPSAAAGRRPSPSHGPSRPAAAAASPSTASTSSSSHPPRPPPSHASSPATDPRRPSPPSTTGPSDTGRLGRLFERLARPSSSAAGPHA